MSGSRFDKLEPKREPDAESPESPGSSPGASLGRFGAERPAAEAPPELPVDPHRPPAQPPPLARFEADGSQGMGLDQSERKDMPFQRCPACQRDCSKYDTACFACGTSLETPEAVAYNDALWAKLKAERAAEVEQLAAKRAAELEAIDEQKRALGVGEYAEDAAEDAAAQRLKSRLIVWACVVGALLLAFLSPWWVLRLGAGIVALVLTLSQIPGAWEALSRPMNRR